jgi:hypothetical protein
MRIFYALLLIPNIAFANIGSFTETKGSGVIKRDSSEFTIEESLGVESMDTVLTERGTARIDFIDDTRVDVTEHSKLIIDEFVYDPAYWHWRTKFKSKPWYCKICKWTNSKEQ